MGGLEDVCSPYYEKKNGIVLFGWFILKAENISGRSAELFMYVYGYVRWGCGDEDLSTNGSI